MLISPEVESTIDRSLKSTGNESASNIYIHSVVKTTYQSNDMVIRENNS